MTKYKKYLPLVILAISALIAFVFDLHSYFTFSNLQKNYAFLNNFVNDNFLQSIICYVMIYILVVLMSIPGSIFLTITGGLLFGRAIGITSAIFAATIGASMLFYGIKIASKNIAPEGKIGKLVNKMQKGFEKNAFFYLLILRLLPIFPFSVINIAAGLSQIPLPIFFFGTLIGMIPWFYILVSFGVTLRDNIMQTELSFGITLEPKMAFIIAVTILLTSSIVIYRRILMKKNMLKIRSFRD